jgi:hypothetical protein
MIHENKIPPSLSQDFTTHHRNDSSLILSLSGRVGIVWLPSNTMLFSSLLALFYYPSWLSLSSVSKG